MPTTYKGLTIPLATDLADGPKAFTDYTDTLPKADAVAAVDIPAGTVAFTCRTVAPVGWVMVDGTTLTGAQTTYPNLWNAVPAAWRVGADIVLPDCRGRMVVGVNPSNVAMDTVGETGGSGTAALAEANLPPHAHAQQGAHASGGASARHNHGSPLGGGSQFIVTNFAAGISAPAGSGASGASLTGQDVQDHAHTTTLSGPTGNGNGTAAPFAVMPPFLAFNVMMRAT